MCESTIIYPGQVHTGFFSPTLRAQQEPVIFLDEGYASYWIILRQNSSAFSSLRSCLAYNSGRSIADKAHQAGRHSSFKGGNLWWDHQIL